MPPTMYSGPPPVWPSASRRLLSTVLSELMRRDWLGESNSISASSARGTRSEGDRASTHTRYSPFDRPQSRSLRVLPFSRPPMDPSALTTRPRPGGGTWSPPQAQQSSAWPCEGFLRRASRMAVCSRTRPSGRHSRNDALSAPRARVTSPPSRRSAGRADSASPSSSDEASPSSPRNAWKTAEQSTTLAGACPCRALSWACVTSSCSPTSFRS